MLKESHTQNIKFLGHSIYRRLMASQALETTFLTQPSGGNVFIVGIQPDGFRSKSFRKINAKPDQLLPKSTPSVIRIDHQGMDSHDSFIWDLYCPGYLPVFWMLAMVDENLPFPITPPGDAHDF